ncbi:uncharacterized protein LAESUDRAFT_753628 [Laetiporus sulphureus 93-53]|uniref:Guanylate-binding protein N-terminal domain-containing protein n=1 Tax=Laetiporus sulphureus 93-53 TaxID=1314785 RepID=A0A165I3R2_9APHY|nr:uncharacterized protein LAESUDRAFT_753628 [Laetiporus sulphureus 93-53]KZT12556.1 hypothetical protein LAESUDRAFT_753628 [Laetiporus sulphureus 93-53]
MSEALSKTATGEQYHDFGDVAGMNIVQTATDDRVLVDEPSELDLITSIRGMYRILDLITEQGSSGLVDKIIIDQQSLGRLINDLQPGAYASLMKVDFAALDNLIVKPIGLYGSKEEIVRFLKDRNVVNGKTADLLRLPNPAAGQPLRPHLRSGLYLLRESVSDQDHGIIYAIFWPEDTTWETNPISTVRHNRMTFMRYLTRVADQIVALISDDDATKIIWQVAETHKQREGVTARSGFTISLPAPQYSDPRYAALIDAARLEPPLIPGETRQGVLQIEYIPMQQKQHQLSEDVQPLRLSNIIETESLQLSMDLSAEALEILMSHGLQKRAPRACSTYLESIHASDLTEKDFTNKRVEKMRVQLENETPVLRQAVHGFVLNAIRKNFWCVTTPPPGDLSLPDATSESLSDDQQFEVRYEREVRDDVLLEHLASLYPKILLVLHKLEDPVTFSIKSQPFQVRKERIMLLDIMLAGRKDVEMSQAKKLISSFLSSENTKTAAELLKEFDSQSKNSPTWQGLPSFIGFFLLSSRAFRQQLIDALNCIAKTDDAKFLSSLTDIVHRNVLLHDACAEVKQDALEWFHRAIPKEVNTVVARIWQIQEEACKVHIKVEADAKKQKDHANARSTLLGTLKDKLLLEKTTETLFITDVQKLSKYNLWNVSYRLLGHREIRMDARLRYRINPFFLTADDQQQMQLNGLFVPTPKLHYKSSSWFELPVEQRIIHVQLLQNDKCLLIVDDNHGAIKTFLEASHTMQGALSRSSYKKILHREKVGSNCMFAFDEQKRMLAVLSADTSKLHILAFDENFASLQSMGSPVDLRPWYDGSVIINHMAFVCGNEEIVLVDYASRARIFSFVTQQFRLASLQLQNPPNIILSSPDGLCLLTINNTGDRLSMRAYHWSTFGSTEGISIRLPDIDPTRTIITSFGKRSHVHVVGVKQDARLCHSIVLDITHNTTEFAFHEVGQNGSRTVNNESVNQNLFIDCHADVWTRFPVLPAVQRKTITSSAQRYLRSLCFVARDNHDNYAAYFTDLVQTFERTTRKPTGDKLSMTTVKAVDYETFANNVIQDISAFRAGEWLVDLLCLIPIHLAITRDNRFIPLRDGVFSAEQERSLLRADAATIIDNLSFGWYESLFQSHIASKPVKVVSSMGEQSVGKSFALNHLLDTSFACSTMRTTEGVWMSVAPLDDMIIVALDFEGVHSIERSVQEDTLLVLFSTAISNLVLFRHNFALSRDMAGLFKSVQSSSSVLDPAANPSLFQSALVIIIKDVADSDKAQIVKEFSLKFQQLERASNFISQLHGGKSMIVPWPVIQSRQFYMLFNSLKRHLDEQQATYSDSSVLLHTLKTLMAKLNVIS